MSIPHTYSDSWDDLMADKYYAECEDDAEPDFEDDSYREEEE